MSFAIDYVKIVNISLLLLLLLLLLPIWIHDWEDINVIEVDNILVGLVTLDQLLEDERHRRRADPLTGMNSWEREIWNLKKH